MLNKIYRKVADFEEETSFARKIRLERIKIFKDFIYDLPKPLTILDIGGTEVFWEIMGFTDDEYYKITLINLYKVKTNYSNIKSIKGDGRYLDQFKDNEFDIVFSNSVIEHVGTFKEKKKMANEMQRVGKRYFLQAPSFYTPLEPHFFFPLFQFLPLKIKSLMIRNFNLGYFKKTPEKEKAKKIIESINLPKKTELKKIFPESTIKKEKFLGFTLSFIVYGKTSYK